MMPLVSGVRSFLELSPARASSKLDRAVDEAR